MIDSNFIKNNKLGTLNVSHEILRELKDYSSSIISRNKEINLIGKSSEKLINTRHIEDSAQTIEFIDKKDIKICTDIGSGAGLPGIVLAILMKHKNPQFKVIFYEKSLLALIVQYYPMVSSRSDPTRPRHVLQGRR